MMKKQTTKATKSSTTKQGKKKIIITTLAVSAAGILGYFGWQYFKKKKERKTANADEILQPQPTPVIPSNSTPKVDEPVWTNPTNNNHSGGGHTNPKQDSEFPLKRGSRGDKVKRLQQAFITKYGNTILPRYGADGDFGLEMAAALKKLKLPATINESTYNVLVEGQKNSTSNTATELYNAATQQDFKKAVSLLKSISSKDDYTTISNQFKNYRINGVRQTLVNGMLNSFTTEEQKQAIRFEFIRMGLQYNGNKWSLSGLGGLPIITTQETTIWVNANTGVNVANRTVLGNEVSRKLDYTLFENNGRHFLVQTKATSYVRN
jgi:hypothetical protein